MGPHKKTLTNEKLKKNFSNPFELVNRAITMAKNLIVVDEEHEYNPANRVLEMIVQGREVPTMPIREKEGDEEE